MIISSKLRRVGFSLAGLGLTVVLASCGGGGGSDNGAVVPPVAVTNLPPASASSSVDGFIAFMKIVVATNDDTGAGYDVSAFVAPTSDITDPDLTVLPMT